MAIHYTTWGPDTCGCSLVYSWDDSVDPSVRVHTFSEVKVRCDQHSSIMDGAILLQTGWDENRRKNITGGLCIALGNLPPEGINQWFSWRFTDGRVLEVTLNIQISANKKQQIQNACDTQFGPGKVVIL